MPKETKIGLVLVVVLVCTFGFIVYKKINRPSEAVATETPKVSAASGRASLAELPSQDEPDDSDPFNGSPFEKDAPPRHSARRPSDRAGGPPTQASEPQGSQRSDDDFFAADGGGTGRPIRTADRTGGFGSRADMFGRDAPPAQGEPQADDDPFFADSGKARVGPQSEPAADQDDWAAQPFGSSRRPTRPTTATDRQENPFASQAGSPTAGAGASQQAGEASDGIDDFSPPVEKARQETFRDDSSPFAQQARGGGQWGRTFTRDSQPEPARDLFAADDEPQPEPEMPDPFAADPPTPSRWPTPSRAGMVPKPADIGLVEEASRDPQPSQPDPFAADPRPSRTVMRNETYDPSRTAVRPSPASHRPQAVDLFDRDRQMFGRDPQPVPDADDPRAKLYIVQANDNYWSISRKVYGTPKYFEALARFNEHRIPDPKRMRPGMKVLTPETQVLEARYPALFPRTAASTGQAASTDPPGFYRDQAGQPWYRVGPNDTLTHIAHRHLGRASRWTQIYEMNRDRLPSPDDLKLGTVLRLPADASRVQVVQQTASGR